MGRKRVLFSLLLGALSACGGGSNGASGGDGGIDGAPQDAAPDADAGRVYDETQPRPRRVLERKAHPSDQSFAADEALEVRIELADFDWGALRDEHRNLGDICLIQDTYTWFEGAVSIDGQFDSAAEVRKKGFLGSLEANRPSLKLKLPSDHLYQGLRRLTLNNNRQSPTLATQCLAYHVMALAGVASPRCNLARVIVNGEDLQAYAHLDSIKPDFLSLYFEHGEGPLYEGQIGDFRPGWLEGLETKNEDFPERADIEALSHALEGPDAGLVAALGEVLDVDAFLTFWAAEAMLGHVDGYAGNTNNFYLFHDPGSGLFHFIPWGMDAVFWDPAMDAGGAATTVFTRGELARRLYGLPHMRARYEARLRELLDDVWDEEALIAEAHRLAGSAGEPSESLQPLEAFIQTRKAALLAELDAGTPGDAEPRFGRSCPVPTLHISASFDGTVIHEDQEGISGTATFSLGEAAPPWWPEQLWLRAEREPNGGVPVIILLGALEGEDHFFALILQLEPFHFTPNTSFPFQGFATVAFALEFDNGTTIDRGLITDGVVHLSETSRIENEPISGSFEAKLYF